MNKDNYYNNNNSDNYIFIRLNQIFVYAMNNPGKVNKNHIALYFWAVAKLNKLFWKEPFGLPTGEARRMIGMKDRRVYWRTLSELKEMGFIKIVTPGKNQYRANQISLPIIDDESERNLENQTSPFDSIHEEIRSNSQSSFWPDPEGEEDDYDEVEFLKSLKSYNGEN